MNGHSEAVLTNYQSRVLVQMFPDFLFDIIGSHTSWKLPLIVLCCGMSEVSLNPISRLG
jgi:hypothetical protein